MITIHLMLFGVLEIAGGMDMEIIVVGCVPQVMSTVRNNQEIINLPNLNACIAAIWTRDNMTAI